MVYSIDKETEFRLWARMLRIRRIEEEIMNRYSHQKMRCPTHLSIGQEAVPVAVGAIATHSDYAVSTHRAHAHYLGKGGNLNAMIAEIHGKETGCAKGRGGSMHLIDSSVGFKGSSAIVGNSIPIGVGLGLAAKLDANKQLSFIFLGDGAIEEGVFYESVNFSVVSKLPVIFICENNLYSVYSPLKVRQPLQRKIWQMVEGMGVKVNHTDGNDVTACVDIIHQATTDCRMGGGPWFLEFSTYRWLEHCGPNFDNDIGYRSEEEFQLWKKNDPILRYGEKLEKTYSDFKNFKQTSEEKIKKEIIEAFEFAEQSPFPVQSTLLQDEYAEAL